MSGIVMYDAIDNSQFPPGAQAYAAYVNGNLADQPNYFHVVAAFPSAHHLSITLFPGAHANVLDVEGGASGPADVPGWITWQHASGAWRPGIYASASTMEAGVLPALSAAGIARSSVRLWTAHYGLGEHICGPSSCGQLSIDADGCQWTETAMGRDLDQSLLLPDFFGTPKPSPAATWTEKIMQQLPEVKQGATGNVVRTVQGLCVARGHAVTVDGSFGNLTRAAVAACQKVAGIAEDGIVGQSTWTVLVTGSASLSVECSHRPRHLNRQVTGTGACQTPIGPAWSARGHGLASTCGANARPDPPDRLTRRPPSGPSGRTGMPSRSASPSAARPRRGRRPRCRKTSAA